MRCFMIAIALCASIPARADWQATKWGMSVPEALAAIPGAVEVQPTTSRDTRVGIERGRFVWRSGRFEFDGRLKFHRLTDRLTSVDLALRDFGNCIDLRHALVQKYGRPSQDSDKRPIWTTDWFVAGTMVSWMQVDYRQSPKDNTCVLFYKSRSDPDTDGL